MKEVPTRFSPTFMTDTFFPEYAADPKTINGGHCYDWAYVAWCLYTQAVLWSNEHHAWVQIGDRYFDSESILGYRRWQNLHFFKRTGINGTIPMLGAIPMPMNLDQFKATGNTYGRFHRDPTMWVDMVDRIKGAGYTPVRT